MLYLSRKIGESIIINDSIEIVVMEVRGKTVKLGFESPKSTSILRKEIHQRIIEENLAAASADVEQDDMKAISELSKKKL